MQIFLGRDGVQAGPYQLDELNHMLASGEVVLTDLAWHVGMATWQPLSELTGGKLQYVPSAEYLALADDGLATQTETTQATLGGQESVHNSETKRRVTVADLYGRAPTAAERLAEEQAEAARRTQTSLEHGKTGVDDKPVWMGRHHATQKIAQQDRVEVAYASVLQRFFAFCINMLLLLASVLPVQLALINSGLDLEQFRADNLSEAMANSQALSQQMLAHIPPSTITLTMLLLIGLVVVQLIMIAKRGQSIGKLVLGIRVVSESTGKVPTLVMGVGLRTIVLYVIYQLAISGLNIFALGLLFVNYMIASNNAKNQGWHDRLAKTVVVKAHPSQLK